MVIHDFVSSCLYYCNVPYSCLSQDTVIQLQSVQNWRLLLLTYKGLCGLAPEYISELLVLYTPARPLRSSERGLLVVSHSRWEEERTVGLLSWAPGWGTVSPWESKWFFKSKLKLFFHAWVIVYIILPHEAYELFFVAFKLLLCVVIVLLTFCKAPK